ncbi:hypothetical protein QAD02_004673 [Eretmocerus hayati]|uniref:Uncharacterized protein n=1 Tax=Eretmocerus hayati TaxID=131215 RepID=A0ACC2NRA5_9HYME|nr:hypothetical protein QAD02_004673 [Eretmocerus hayati]
MCSVMFLTYLVVTDTPGGDDPLPCSNNNGKLDIPAYEHGTNQTQAMESRVSNTYQVDYRSGPVQVETQNQHKRNLNCIRIDENPKFLQYVHVEIRLSSFNDWPISISQTKEQLAAAGFFHTGRGDSTTCYHCGLTLQNWEPLDIPWNQHAKWFPGCLFLNLSKERAFIDDFSCSLLPSSTSRKLSPIIKKLRNFTPLPKEDNGKLNHPPQTNKIIENSELCRICFNEEIGVVFLSCGHLITSIKCAPNLKVCPFCRSHLTMELIPESKPGMKVQQKSKLKRKNTKLVLSPITADNHPPSVFPSLREVRNSHEMQFHIFSS